MGGRDENGWGICLDWKDLDVASARDYQDVYLSDVYVLVSAGTNAHPGFTYEMCQLERLPCTCLLVHWSLCRILE